MPSACPNCRRLTVNRGLKRVATPRSITRSAAVDCPHQVGSQADSAGSIPVTRSTREKRCSTSESDCISQAGQPSFASENGTRAIARAISHLGECPWRLSVPKLTVQVRFPSPAPREKAVAAVVVVRSFCTALKPPASPTAKQQSGGHAASGRSRPPPSCGATATRLRLSHAARQPIAGLTPD